MDGSRLKPSGTPADFCMLGRAPNAGLGRGQTGRPAVPGVPTRPYPPDRYPPPKKKGSNFRVPKRRFTVNLEGFGQQKKGSNFFGYVRTVPGAPTRPYQKKRQQFLEKRQQCRVPKRRFTVNLQRFWQKKGSNFWKKGSNFSGCVRTVPGAPTRPYQKKRQQFLEKRQQCRVPKRRFTVNLQGSGPKKKAAIFGKKAAAFSGTSVPYPVHPPDRTKKKAAIFGKKAAMPSAKTQIYCKFTGFWPKKRAAIFGKKAATFSGTSVPYPRPSYPACRTSAPYLSYQRTIPVVPPYRTCCTTVPYLLYHRTVPVVPPYRTCCTTVPYLSYHRTAPKKGSNFLKKGSNVLGKKRRFTVNLQGFGQKKGSNF